MYGGANKALTSRAIIGRFYETLEAGFGGSWVSLLSMLFTSDQESETYKWLGMTPMLREWVGGRNPKILKNNGMTIENLLFESTLEIHKKDLKRDKTGQILIRIDEMADRANDHWAKLLSSLIANGSTLDCYDGKKFFAANHVEGKSGTQKNLLTASAYSELNVTTAANPTAAELADAIVKIIQHMFSIKDDQGEPLNGMARKFLVMVPVNMFGNAVKAVKGNLLYTGSGAVDNPIKNMDGFEVEVTTNPRLTATTSLHVFRTDGRTKPLIRQEESPIEMTAIAEGSELEFKENKHHYGIEASRNVGLGLWQHAVKATLS